MTGASSIGTCSGTEPQGGGLIGSGSQVTGSRATGSQTTGATTSGTQSQAVNWDEDEFVSPLEVTLGKRKPKWLQEILKRAQSVGTPKRDAGESKVPEIFYSYVAMVSCISESDPSSYEQTTGEQV